MGRAVREALSEFPEIRLDACVAPRGSGEGERRGAVWLTPDDLRDRSVRERLPADLVVLDFSLAPGTARLLPIVEEWPRALVSATTGLDAATESRLDGLAKRVPVFRAPNLSLGVAIMAGWLRALPAGARSAFAADIVEHHHSGKKDAPSGTALELAKLLGPRREGDRPAAEPRIHSIRAGSAPGIHRIILSGAGETLEIIHTAWDRTVFARGALRAVLFIHGRAPGRYSIDQLLRET